MHNQLQSSASRRPLRRPTTTAAAQPRSRLPAKEGRAREPSRAELKGNVDCLPSRLPCAFNRIDYCYYHEVWLCFVLLSCGWNRERARR